MLTIEKTEKLNLSPLICVVGTSQSILFTLLRSSVFKEAGSKWASEVTLQVQVSGPNPIANLTRLVLHVGGAPSINKEIRFPTSGRLFSNGCELICSS